MLLLGRGRGVERRGGIGIEAEGREEGEVRLRCASLGVESGKGRSHTDLVRLWFDFEIPFRL